MSRNFCLLPSLFSLVVLVFVVGFVCFFDLFIFVLVLLLVWGFGLVIFAKKKKIWIEVREKGFGFIKLERK